MDLTGVGRRIAIARKNKKMTQVSLCEKIDIYNTSLSAIEHGKKLPSLFTIASISEVLEVSIDWLVNG